MPIALGNKKYFYACKKTDENLFQDIPIMKQSGISVDPGQSLQVAVTPTLTTTTEASKRRFAPVDRTCYFEEEVSLKHFPPDADYRFNYLDKLRKVRALWGGNTPMHVAITYVVL